MNNEVLVKVEGSGLKAQSSRLKAQSSWLKAQRKKEKQMIKLITVSL